MSFSVLLELQRHKTWATLKVIELCQGLAPELLEQTVPGTYGSVRATLRHLVGGDERYFNLLTDTPGGPPAEDISLAELRDRFAAMASRWEALLHDAVLAEREFTTRQGVTLGIAPMAQSIHHAEVHRTHILSTLGALGVQVPDLDVWEFGIEQGYVRPPAVAS